ncbi:hypothetical protein ACFLZX_03460 [Nanoarchaeota archaeon]
MKKLIIAVLMIVAMSTTALAASSIERFGARGDIGVAQITNLGTVGNSVIEDATGRLNFWAKISTESDIYPEILPPNVPNRADVSSRAIDSGSGYVYVRATKNDTPYARNNRVTASVSWNHRGANRYRGLSDVHGPYTLAIVSGTDVVMTANARVILQIGRDRQRFFEDVTITYHTASETVDIAGATINLVGIPNKQANCVQTTNFMSFC